MLLQKDKKILIYFFLFVVLGSINNKYFVDTKIFKIKDFKLDGLNEKEKLDLLLQFDQFKEQNIFYLSKDEIIKILDKNNLIDSFLINKNYPSNLNIKIEKTKFLANIDVNGKNYLIGSNKKLIQTESNNESLPNIFGNPSLDDFFLIKNNISKSSINFNNIKNLFFFPSNRWDLELKNGILIKLPNVNSVDALNNYFKLIKLPEFQNVKVFDMRINKQIIINEL